MPVWLRFGLTEPVQEDATRGSGLGLDTPQEMVGFILFLSFLFYNSSNISF